MMSSASPSIIVGLSLISEHNHHFCWNILVLLGGIGIKEKIHRVGTLYVFLIDHKH